MCALVFGRRLGLTAGSGLLYYANFRTQLPMVLGVSVFAGLGVAFFLRTFWTGLMYMQLTSSIENVILALQVELRETPRMIAKGTGTMNFIGLIGRIIGCKSDFSQYERSFQLQCLSPPRSSTIGFPSR